MWSYSYRRCTEPLPGKAEGRPWKRSSPPQRPLRTSRTLTTLSFRYQFKFSPKERATASSKRLQCFRSALRLKSSFLYERKSADLEGKTREIPLRERERETPSKLERRALTLLLSRLTSQIEIPELGLIMRSHLRSQKPGLTMRFQLRCQNHCTFPPRELSRVDWHSAQWNKCLLSWLGSQIEILKSGLTMRSHLRSQKRALTMRFQLRCQNHCTFPPWELSKARWHSAQWKMPHFSPDWGPKSRSQIRTYNEVSFEISETRSYNEFPYWDLKTMSPQTLRSQKICCTFPPWNRLGRWRSAPVENSPKLWRAFF